MSLWGNNDNVTTASAGIITASGFNGVVVGTATTFTNYSVGQTLTLGVGATSGFGVIETITSNTAMILKDDSLPGALEEAVQTYTGASDSFTVGERPISLTHDPNFAPTSSNAQRDYTSKVFGVNETIQSARKTANSKYAQTHAGWVGVTTYLDMHGTLRVKSETFVAMSGITSQTQASANVLPA
jgi:hypothetical protein